MLMRKLLLSLSLVLMSVMTAMAQYSVKIETYPHGNWLTGTESLPLTEIAGKLGYADAAALEAAFNGYEADPSTQIVWGKLAGTGEFSNETTADPQGFWMNGAGEIVGYGDEALWYAFVTTDAAEDALNVSIGMMPNTAAEGADYKTTFYLRNGDKEVTIDIEEVINVKPTIDVEVPTSYASLDIVKKYDYTLELFQGNSYEGKTITIDMPDIYEAIGMDAAKLDEFAADVTLIRTVNQEGEGDAAVYSISDNLLTPAAASGGAWLGRYVNYDEATDTEIPIYMSMPMEWGGSYNTIYVQDIAIADGKFTFVTGQFPGKLSPDSQDYVELYITNGTKTAQLNIKIAIVEKKAVDFSEWEKVGEQTVEIEHYIAGSGARFDVDLAAVAAALGCDEGDVALNILADENGISEDHTATKGGCWMTKEGYSINWGVDGYAMYIEPQENMKFTDFSVGFNDSAWELGDDSNIKVFFNFNGKYFLYTLHVKITEKPASEDDPDSKFDIAGVIEFTQQIIPSSSYYGGEPDEVKLQMQKNLGIEYIQSVIGEGNYKVYALDVPAKAGAQPTVTDATSYAVNTDIAYSAGYWMSMPADYLAGTDFEKTAFAGVWGNCPFGVEFAYSLGIIGFDQMPGHEQVGNSYDATFYWVNTDNNKALKIIAYVEFVDEITDVDDVVTVGSYDMDYAVTSAEFDEGEIRVELDTESLYRLLDVDAETADALTVLVPRSSSSYKELSWDTSFGINEQGYYEDVESENMIMNGYVEIDGGVITYVIDPMSVDFSDHNTKAIAKVAFIYDGKRYTYDINLFGTESIGATDNSSAFFTQFSDYYTITKNQVAFIQFQNFSSKANNWNNWVLVTTPEGAKRGEADYSELFTVRADNYAWAKGNANINTATAPELVGTLESEFNWDTFKEDMYGAMVGMTITFSDENAIVVDAQILTKDGKELPYKFTSIPVENEALSFFFTVDASHIKDLAVSIEDKEIDVAIKDVPSFTTTLAPAAGIYTVTGAKVATLQKGINIVVDAMGNVKKYLVK